MSMTLKRKVFAAYENRMENENAINESRNCRKNSKGLKANRSLGCLLNEPRNRLKSTTELDSFNHKH